MTQFSQPVESVDSTSAIDIPDTTPPAVDPATITTDPPPLDPAQTTTAAPDTSSS